MVTFPAPARLALGLVVALLGFIVGSQDLHISVELAGAIAALTGLLASAGVVPPKPGDLPPLAPWLRFTLTAAVVAGTYVVQTLSIDLTLRGLIIAALNLAASVGIVPPQAR